VAAMANDLINVGTTNLNKGELRPNVTLKAWDSVSVCTDKECPLHNKCNYLKRGKCGVQVDYLRTFSDTMLSMYKYLDEGSLFKIGMHLMPLYSYLCKLKIVEASLNGVINTTSKGIIQIHPIYKEIRETLKAIMMVGRDLDLYVNGEVNAPDINLGKKDQLGDPEHYKNISVLADRKRIVR
jgi:hypothetical protein